MLRRRRRAQTICADCGSAAGLELICPADSLDVRYHDPTEYVLRKTLYDALKERYVRNVAREQLGGASPDKPKNEARLGEWARLLYPRVRVHPLRPPCR